MVPDVLERGVALADVSVEADASVLAADEVPVHDAGPHEDVGGLEGGRLRLDDNPEERRGNELQRVGKAVQVVPLGGPVVRGGHDDQQLAERIHGLLSGGGVRGADGVEEEAMGRREAAGVVEVGEGEEAPEEANEEGEEEGAEEGPAPGASTGGQATEEAS